MILAVDVVLAAVNEKSHNNPKVPREDLIGGPQSSRSNDDETGPRSERGCCDFDPRKNLKVMGVNAGAQVKGNAI